MPRSRSSWRHSLGSASRAERIGLAAAAGAAIGFGASYPLTAIALRSWSALGSAAVQGTGALLLLGLLALAGIVPRPSRASWSGGGPVRLALLGLLGGVTFTGGMNVAVALAGPTIAGFVASQYAVVAALLAVPLLGEHIRAGTLASFALALAGTLLLAGVRPTETSLAGIACGLVAALGFGLYLVLSRRWSTADGLDGTSITFANLIGRGPAMLVIALTIHPAGVFPGQVDAVAALAMLGLVLVPSILSQLLILASVRRIPARRSSAMLLLAPVTAAVASALVLGEGLTPGEVVGGALVVVGIAGASGALGSVSSRLR